MNQTSPFSSRKHSKHPTLRSTQGGKTYSPKLPLMTIFMLWTNFSITFPLTTNNGWNTSNSLPPHLFSWHFSETRNHTNYGKNIYNIYVNITHKMRDTKSTRRKLPMQSEKSEQTSELLPFTLSTTACSRKSTIMISTKTFSPELSSILKKYMKSLNNGYKLCLKKKYI